MKTLKEIKERLSHLQSIVDVYDGIPSGAQLFIDSLNEIQFIKREYFYNAYQLKCLNWPDHLIKKFNLKTHIRHEVDALTLDEYVIKYCKSRNIESPITWEKLIQKEIDEGKIRVRDDDGIVLGMCFKSKANKWIPKVLINGRYYNISGEKAKESIDDCTQSILDHHERYPNYGSWMERYKS